MYVDPLRCCLPIQGLHGRARLAVGRSGVEPRSDRWFYRWITRSPVGYPAFRGTWSRPLAACQSCLVGAQAAPDAQLGVALRLFRWTNRGNLTDTNGF